MPEGSYFSLYLFATSLYIPSSKLYRRYGVPEISELLYMCPHPSAAIWVLILVHMRAHTATYV